MMNYLATYETVCNVVNICSSIHSLPCQRGWIVHYAS
ncbi:hypothetical protein SLEP1_g6291 [Rubroshorea leprosula]|uniref:Uncharacterized protein n=1 Tax=Rubroshorea leprosula TaxID=152421 RepID=A0AAV5I2V0_9ROSI|nr:hypothetical protein SLEP1_g6291 [Rubroshorea leprosula]